MENKNDGFYMVGIHNEKLNSLESGQEKLVDQIDDLRTELKEDMKSLIEVVKENTEVQFRSFDRRLSRVESVLLWAASGMIATLFAFMWGQVTR